MHPNSSVTCRDRTPPAQVAERIAYRTAAERAVREREEKFGPVTPENFQEQISWQEARIRELTKETK